MSNKNSEEFWNNKISLNRKLNGNTFYPVQTLHNYQTT